MNDILIRGQNMANSKKEITKKLKEVVEDLMDNYEK